MARVKIDYSLKPFEVISLGAGKQSTLMLLKALNGDFEIMPDAAVFADTGNEPKYVYDHVNLLKEFVWAKFNFKIHIVSNGSLIEDCLNHVSGKSSWSPTPPLWLSNNGFLKRQCTLHLKLRPIRQFVRKYHNLRPVRIWIGISYDEMERQKDSDVQYISHYYPLVENKISLDSIKKEYQTIGVPEPGKSACIVCPFHSDFYWSRLKVVEPDSFELACSFDESIRNFPGRSGKCYLHRSSRPLRSLDFTGKNTLFPELIEECEGLCGL